MAWEHLWELSLAPADGRDSTLAAWRTEHEEARARVAEHISLVDEARAAAAVAERQLAAEKAEQTDGYTGFRRGLRDLIALTGKLQKEEALTATLTIQLDALTAACTSAQRLATIREGEVSYLREVMSRMEAHMSALRAAAAAAEAAAAEAAAKAAPPPPPREDSTRRGSLLGAIDAERRAAETEWALTQRDEANANSYELTAHERAQLETLREEVRAARSLPSPPRPPRPPQTPHAASRPHATPRDPRVCWPI